MSNFTSIQIKKKKVQKKYKTLKIILLLKRIIRVFHIFYVRMHFHSLFFLQSLV